MDQLFGVLSVRSMLFFRQKNRFSNLESKLENETIGWINQSIKNASKPPLKNPKRNVFSEGEEKNENSWMLTLLTEWLPSDSCVDW